MKTKHLKNSLKVLFIILLLTACKKENEQIKQTTTTQNQQQTLSLQEVTDWYKRQADTTSLQANSLGPKTFTLRSLQPDLSRLQSIQTKKGNFWLVHLQGQPRFQNLAQGYRKLAFQKDSAGHIRARILEIIPDGLYIQRRQKAETKDFTGRVFIYDQSYHLTGGFVYSQGKLIGQIKPKPQTAITSSTRLQTNTLAISEDCQWYDSSYVDADGVFTVYSENICTYSIYDDGMGGGGGAPAGGGGDYLGDGGGGGGDAPSAPAPSNLPDENHPKINPKPYLDCFGTVPNTNASMKVTVYVQEPFPGTSFNYGPNSVGHTAIGLTKTGGGQTVTQVMGFYPDAAGKDKMHAPGKLVDNSQLNYNVSITYNVDAVQFANLINYLNSPLPAYDITEMNCTGYAYAACRYAGITLPNPYTTVGLPYPDGTQAQAMTPAGLGNSIQLMQGKPGVNTSGGTGPATHGPCN